VPVCSTNALPEPVSDARINTSEYVGDQDEAAEWLEGQFGGWTDSLTSDEMNAMISYTESPFMNDLLRSGEALGNLTYAAEIANIDSAIMKGVILEDIILYRGMSEKFLGSMETGSVWSDQAYVSASLIDQEARLFGVGSGNIVVQIFVPGGTPGAYLGPISGYEEEREILLARGSRFRFRGRFGSRILLELIS
jgi:hypothetical protein